jgi:DNA repair exonuclease SbcCD ATPase subunit
VAISNTTPILPDDPAALKAIIASLQAENAQMSATLRAHDLLVQSLRIRIAKLKKQAFGKKSEKIEREIEQLEFALESISVAVAEITEPEQDEGDTIEVVAPDATDEETKPLRRRPRVSKDTPRERRELDPGDSCPECGGELRVLGEDVSELIDMITAQLKVIHCPAGSCIA